MTNEPIIICNAILRAWFVRHRNYLERTKTFVLGFVFVLAYRQIKFISPIEVKRTQLVLKQTQPHESTDVPESVEAFQRGPALHRRVEAPFSRTVEESGVVLRRGFSIWAGTLTHRTLLLFLPAVRRRKMISLLNWLLEDCFSIYDV